MWDSSKHNLDQAVQLNLALICRAHDSAAPLAETLLPGHFCIVSFTLTSDVPTDTSARDSGKHMSSSRWVQTLGSVALVLMRREFDFEFLSVA